MNIVLDNNNLSHIFDSTSNNLGEFDKNRIYMYKYNECLIHDMYFIKEFLANLLGFKDNLGFLNQAAYSLQDDFQNIRAFEILCAKREQDFKRFKAQNSCYFDDISDNVQKLARKLL